MKKILILIAIILIIIIVPIMTQFSTYKSGKKAITKFNLSYEQYLGKKLYGSEVGSLINRATDNNETYKIEKDEKGKYIDDDKYCLIIDINIPILDENGNEVEDLYRMETITELGVDRFVKNFNIYEFEIEDTKYNQLGRINYIKIKMTL